MASINDVFSYSHPVAFADEAPRNSISIGERIANTALDAADALLRARYGDKAAIPAGSRTGQYGAVNNGTGAAGGSNWFLLIVAVLILILFLRR